MAQSTTTTTPTLAMNDGRAIPQVGLGVWQVEDDVAERVVATAIRGGYRLIDTAALYHNERGTGRGLAAGGVARDDLFVTTKLWNDRHGTDEAVAAFGESLEKLGLDAVDLYLIHWPAPRQDRYVETWKTLVLLREEGRARSIGVSNFDAEQIERIADATGVMPALNQIELSPVFQQRALKDFHDRHGIVTQAWSPLGRGRLLDDARIVEIARKHGVSPAQAIIRWHVERGHSVIPKSVTPERIASNIDVFGFALDGEDMAMFEAMDSADGRFGPDPAQFG